MSYSDNEIENEIQAKGLTAPRVTPADIETNIAAEYFFTAEQAVSGASSNQIAQVAHEVNRAYCEALGDMSQSRWEDAPQWQRDSAMLGVKLHTEHPSAGAQASHESWMSQKLAEGWKYGPVKNPETKEHPCIVPFGALPTAQQAKDYIFRGVVHSVSNVFLGAPVVPALGLLTFCVLVLKNGFTVTGESACASPENFDAEIGRKIARQKAIEKIWPLMGYALKDKLQSVSR
jgi:hypothetical protein